MHIPVEFLCFQCSTCHSNSPACMFTQGKHLEFGNEMTAKVQNYHRNELYVFNLSRIAILQLSENCTWNEFSFTHYVYIYIYKISCVVSPICIWNKVAHMRIIHVLLISCLMLSTKWPFSTECNTDSILVPNIFWAHSKKRLPRKMKSVWRIIMSFGKIALLWSFYQSQTLQPVPNVEVLLVNVMYVCSRPGFPKLFES